MVLVHIYIYKYVDWYSSTSQILHSFCNINGCKRAGLCWPPWRSHPFLLLISHDGSWLHPIFDVKPGLIVTIVS